jgi:predicted O-methyltransferase YrrM
MLTGEYDFIFMDGPKTRYIEYLPYLDKLLVKGGTMVCDNVLINGWISGESQVSDKKKTIATGIEKFLETLYSDERYSTCIIPVGDGMSWSIKERG